MAVARELGGAGAGQAGQAHAAQQLGLQRRRRRRRRHLVAEEFRRVRHLRSNVRDQHNHHITTHKRSLRGKRTRWTPSGPPSGPPSGSLMDPRWSPG